ncbi:MAG: hypothetical protein BWZ06_01871 [Bacteroidetes bacterium ADurb.BinA261]|nr:MAG: hypothetical protein BWZ06_01871 [Bacteroidetes bacterium ADurb.BinA261]
MPLWFHRSCDEVARRPRFGCRKIVVQNKPLSETHPIVAESECFNNTHISQHKVKPIVIVSFSVIGFEKWFTRIFFGNKAGLNLIAIGKRIFERSVEILAQILSVWIPGENTIREISVTGSFFERFIEPKLNFGFTVFYHFVYRRRLLCQSFAYIEKWQYKLNGVVIETRNISQFVNRI